MHHWRCWCNVGAMFVVFMTLARLFFDVGVLAGFWLATLFGLGWPYRIIFRLATRKTKYTIVKVIFSPAPPPNFDHTSECPEIDKLKMNIRGMLCQLNVNVLSVYEEEMPVSCGTTDEHDHVTISL